MYNEQLDYYTHINLASNVCNYTPINLGELIKDGVLSKIQNYHRITIDNATKNSVKKKKIIINNEIWKDFINNAAIPLGCKTCPNHPSNGGSGICNCILGTPQITC